MISTEYRIVNKKKNPMSSYVSKILFIVCVWCCYWAACLSVPFPAETSDAAESVFDAVPTEPMGQEWQQVDVPISSAVSDMFKQVFLPPLDILLVIDQSSSMQDNQKHVESQLYAWFQTLLRLGPLDYQLARIDFPPAAHQVRGAFHQPDAVLRGQDTSVLSKIRAKLTMQVVNQLDSAVLDTILATFSPPLLLPGTTYAQFLRKDAVLFLIIVTDKDDQSVHEPEVYVQKLQALKGRTAHPNIMVQLISGGTNGCQSPLGQAGSAVRLDAFAKNFLYGTASICESLLGLSLSNVRPTVGFFRHFHLSRNPKVDSIAVWINRQKLPLQGGDGKSQWQYVARLNQIELFVPTQPGDMIEIRYETASSD